MLTDIRIEGFRGIRNIELNNIHPVNLSNWGTFLLSRPSPIAIRSALCHG